MKINCDSRTIQPDEIFIPIKGKTHDGHAFIQEVLDKGAQVLDVDLYEFTKKYRKKLNCHVIAVTGSAGKTTVKDLLHSVLSQRFNVVKTEQNQNNEIGAPLTVLKADHLTEILIVEVAMRHLGEIRYLAKCVRPTHVVITNIGLSHIEELKTPKNIAKAKAEIFCPKLAWERDARIAFLNHETPFYEYLAGVAETKKFTVFPFNGKDKPEQNINLCYTVGRHFGLSNAEIQKGIEAYTPSDHRLNIIKKGTVTLIDDTYNANPDGVKYACEYLKRFSQRKILVIADMLELGEFTDEEHQKIPQLALEAGVSILYTYGPHANKITSEELTIYHYQDQDKLAQALNTEIKDNDIVLLKGSRGMKLENVVSKLHP